MRGQRPERLIRISSRFLRNPSKVFSLTDMARDFSVSKTIVSEDVEVIDDALKEENIGHIAVDRGRTGGASFISKMAPEYRNKMLAKIAEELTSPSRLLPGGLIYYSDLILDPFYASFLGNAIASDFIDVKPDVVMTSEMKGIPIAIFAAHFLGVPLAVCRYRNQPSDGSAVSLHFPTRSDVRTIYLGTRHMKRQSRVLIVDDFMRGGSTAAGMLLMAREFESEIVGVGVFIASAEPGIKSVSKYNSLLTLTEVNGTPSLEVVSQS